MSRDVTVGPFSSLEDGVAQRIDSGAVSICVVRCGDAVYAINDVCSHEDYSLSEGEVWEDTVEIECPRHGSTFDLRDGTPCSLPATKPVPVYEVRVDADEVSVVLP